MDRKKLLVALCLLVSVIISTSNVFGAKKAKTAVPLNSAGEKLLAEYTEMLTDLRAEIEKSVPTIDEKKSAAFMKAYAAVGAARGNAWKDKGEFAATFKPVEEAQSKALVIAKPILKDIDPFLANDKLDALLVKFAVLANATPRGLAEFAQQGKEQKALIDKLLSDTVLMKQMLEAGGARVGKYGEAMQIYTDIMKTSKRARKGGIFQRLAIGTSIELAIPVTKHTKTEVDPVKRYLHYEKAYLDGELDPEFKHMSAWECRFITNSDASDEELAWGRQMLRNYRPDHIFTADYRWRYSRSVKTDVAYKRPEWSGVGLRFQQLINGGGKCGPRAFFGRFMLRSFGIPTFGVRQRGHAALSHWTPDGWTVNLGAHWRWSWWDRPGHARSGEDFLLETQAREYPKDYIKVLRAQWVGDALGEQKVNGRRLGTGGLWNALALYQKRAIVAEAKPVEVALAGEDIAEANESTKAEKIMQTEISEADRKIVVDKKGVITIPAAACSKPTNNTAKIVFMKSFSGGMQLHYNRLGKEPEVFEYEFETPKAGRYNLVGRVVTVNMNQHLLVTPNNAGTPIDIALPYTVGMWENTRPVEIELVKGKNILHFTRNIPNYGLTIKYFTLTPVKK